MTTLDVALPSWPEPERLRRVRAMTTTQRSDWTELSLPASPLWLSQVHGIGVLDLANWQPGVEADAAFTSRAGQVAVVKTADCLPILLASDAPHWVAAVHAGWRGLAAGMIEAAVGAFPGSVEQLQAWVGPSISQQAYEVGMEVYEAFVDPHPELATYFMPSRPGHYRADLAGIAAHKLSALGVRHVALSGLCTAAAPKRFYSYRHGQTKEGKTGRMASLIWLE